MIPDELSHGLPVGLVLCALPREQNHAQALPAPARLHRTQRIKNSARKKRKLGSGLSSRNDRIRPEIRARLNTYLGILVSQDPVFA